MYSEQVLSMEIQVEQTAPEDVSVWQYFYQIRDATELGPSEEQGEPWCAIVNGDLAGMAVVDTFGTEPYFIHRIAVDKSYRRCGVGTALLDAILSEYESVRCEVRTRNDASIGMLESAGFVRTGSHEVGDVYFYASNPN